MEKKLNLGSGPNWKENGWKIIERDLGYDLNEKHLEDFEDNTISLIFASHIIEHLTWENVPRVFSNSYRILKPGGVLRIIVPDMEIWNKCLVENDKQYIIDSNPYYQTEARRNASILDDIKEQIGYYEPNDFLRRGHRSFYTYPILNILLRYAGFEKVYRSAFGQSKAKEMRKQAELTEKGMPIAGFDNILVSRFSLYMEAEK
jgi:ubiquinone/menaquinone biosynthesis C-methylase UbiE